MTSTGTCGTGAPQWVHKIDWTTGFPIWTGIYGAASGNVQTAPLSLHPTLPLYCGMISFARFNFGVGCDLDFTAGNNRGDNNPNPNLYWSIFPFCQNVSSNTLVPPAWARSISSSTGDGSLTFIESMRNKWGGNNVFIQVVSRYSSTQGLVWPVSGSLFLVRDKTTNNNLLTSMNADGGYLLSSPPAGTIRRIYYWGRNQAGGTIWADNFRANGR